MSCRKQAVEDRKSVQLDWLAHIPVSSEISHLCKIFDLLLFVSHVACQSRGMKLGNYLFDMYCVNQTFQLDVRCPQQAAVQELLQPLKNIGLKS